MDNFMLSEEFNSHFPNHMIEIKSIENVPYFCVPVSDHPDSATSENVLSVPLFDRNKDYSAECARLRELNEEITVNIENINNDIHEIKERIVEMEKAPPPVRAKKYQICKKRDRRKAEEIKKAFSCQFCTKRYGSEGSLNHHMKLKHPEQFREVFLQRNLDFDEIKLK